MNNSTLNNILNNISFFVNQVKKIIYLIYSLFIEYFYLLKKIILTKSCEIDYDSDEHNEIDKIENTEIIDKNTSTETKIIFNENILDFAISNTVQIVKNIVNKYKFLKNNSKKILNVDNDNYKQLYNLTIPNTIDADTNYINIIKKKIYNSELSDIVNNLSNDEINNLANGLLKSIINISKNLQINDNKLFNKYLNIILSKKNNISNDLLDNLSDSDFDSDFDSNNNSDNDSDNDLDNKYNSNIINNLIIDYNKPYINKNINISNIIELIDEIEIK
jgi:hypothetical protein